MTAKKPAAPQAVAKKAPPKQVEKAAPSQPAPKKEAPSTANAVSEREKHEKDRDKFQEKLDSNREWHRPQEHTFEVPANGPAGKEAKPIVGGTSAGFLFLDTGGEKRLDSAQVLNLVQELQAAFQAVS